MIRFVIEIVIVLIIISLATMKVDGVGIMEYGSQHGYKKAINRVWDGPPPAPVQVPVAKELDEALKDVQQ